MGLDIVDNGPRLLPMLWPYHGYLPRQTVWIDRILLKR